MSGPDFFDLDPRTVTIDVELEGPVILGASGPAGPPGADGEGVPTGGTAGQVLTKDTITDFDTSWQTPTGGGGGAPSGPAGGSLSGTYPAPTLLATSVADLNPFTTSLKGVTPASGGGTANFLRADGTWNAPPAGASLTALHSALIGVKVWSGSAYVWSGDGTAPDSNAFTNIMFVDPTGTHDPKTSTGGRNVANDLWETGVAAGGTSSGLGGIIALTRYAPATYTVVQTSSSTFTDVDATNLAVTFTVPSSGKVLIELAANWYSAASAGTTLVWNLREGSTDLAGTPVALMALATFSTGAITYGVTKHYVSGLTAGASKTYKWGQARGGGTVNVGTSYGPEATIDSTPAFMTVYSVP